MTSLRRGIALSVLGLAGLYTMAVADEPKFKGTVLDRVMLGSLNGDYIMKVTMLDMKPGAQVPEHTHKGPGLRYVLEGAITIAWKEGRPKQGRLHLFRGGGLQSPHRSDVGEERSRWENARPDLRVGPEGIMPRAED